MKHFPKVRTASILRKIRKPALPRKAKRCAYKRMLTAPPSLS